jgi:hypothetical protein
MLSDIAPHRPWIRTAATVVGAALLIPASAGAAAWTRPATLSGPPPKAKFPEDRVPLVAVNRRGESIAAWPAKGEGPSPLLVAGATARGRFGRPRRVGDGFLEAAAIAGDGTAVVTWRSGSVIKAAVRVRHGRFGRPQVLSLTGSGFSDIDSRAAVDRDGDVVVAWSSSKRAAGPGGGFVEQSRAAFLRSGGRFGAARTIAAGSVSGVTFDRAGRVIASLVLRTESGGVFPVPFARTSVALVAIGSASGRFDAPVTVSSSPTYNVRADVGPGGEIGVGWERAEGPEANPYGPILTAIQSPGGQFEAPVSAPVARADRSSGPWLAFGAGDELAAVWRERLHPRSDGAMPLYWAARRPGAPFGPRQVVTASEVTHQLFATTGDGRAIMVWSDGPLRAALYRSATGFMATSAPRGRIATPLRASSLAAAGDFAALAWRDADGRLRASVRKLPD